MTPVLTGHRPARRPSLSDSWRRLLSHLLRSASAALARQARDVARPLHARQRRRSQHDVSVEFHAEAGAPEGALFVDGELVGYVQVRRL
ncbi:MAG: hypothetical protein ACJ8GJ_20680 [Vitreoscilla sp.]